MTSIADYTLVEGLFLRFADESVERMYVRRRSGNPEAVLRSLGLLLFSLTMVYIGAAFLLEPWDYDDLPEGAHYVFSGRALLLLLSTVPLALAKFGTHHLSPECIECALYVASLLGTAVAGGIMSFWRVGVFVHGDGGYIFDRLGGGATATSKPTETLVIAVYFCASMCYFKVPLIRASRAWMHMLVTYLLLLGLLLIPGLSPEDLSTRVIVAVIAAVYYCHMLEELSKAEKVQRMSWAVSRQADEEANLFQETEENRARNMIRSVSDEHNRMLMKALVRAVESEDGDRVLAAKQSMLSQRWTRDLLDAKEAEVRKTLSEERGVTLSYLLSDEFEELARTASGLQDPNFHDLVKPFFHGPNAIGRDSICPRDGQKGCALVDSLPSHCRKRCTHFLSWTWSTKLSVVREALKRWADRNCHEPEEVAFFMCFFVNNQYRILLPGSESKGSDSLGETFERNLCRTGRMVALLDTYDKPTYLTRIWTIFEQFTAMRLGVEVEVTLPSGSRDALIKEFERGREGIMRVRDAMSTVDSSRARASDPADEQKVKSKIVESVGFKEVDTAIKRVTCEWVAAELRAHMDEIMHEG